MKEAGWALIVIAGLTLLFGLLIDVSVTTPYIPGGAYAPSVPSQQVANIHKMHIQELVVQGSFFMFLSGVVLIGCGAIVGRLEGGGERSSDDAGISASSDRLDARIGPAAAESEGRDGSDPSSKDVIGALVFMAAIIVIGGGLVAVFAPDQGTGGIPNVDTDVFNADTENLDNIAAESERLAREAANLVGR
jgi:hypothetical protein